MRNLINTRLKELQIEYKKGQERLTSLEQEQNNIQNSMLRISGAIQILEELSKIEAIPTSNNNGIQHLQTEKNGEV